MLSRRAFDRLLDQYGPLVARAFERAVAEMKSRAQIAELARAVRAGSLDEGLRLAGWREGQWAPVSETLRETFVNVGQAAAGEAPNRFGFIFNPSNPRAERWLVENSSRLITRIDQQTREVVRTALRAGLEAGRNPRSTALDLVGRLNRRTGRREGGVLGLTPQLAGAVRNNRSDLASGNPLQMARYFGRELRDRRFDSIVERAIREGRAVEAGDIERISTRYSDRLLEHRGEVVARTETLQAASAARDEAVSQAVDEGLVREKNVTKVWRTATDSRVRDSHDGMNGQEKPQGAAFLTDTGARLLYPGDQSLGAPAAEIIQCRCSVFYRVDWAEQAGTDGTRRPPPSPPPSPPPAVPPAPPPSPARSPFSSGAGPAVDALWDSTDDITALSNAIGVKPSRVVVERRGFYQPRTTAIHTRDNPGTFTHEYGHFLDFQLNSAIDGNSSKLPWSLMRGMHKTLEQDARASKLIGSTTGRERAIADFKQNHLELLEFGNISGFTERNKHRSGYLADIYDAATRGRFEEAGLPGHGRAYYQKDSMVATETFANMVRLRGAPEWEEIERVFPRTAALFDELITEALERLGVST